MTAIQQYFHVVLFIMLCKLDKTFKSAVDESLVCDHSEWKLLSSTFMSFQFVHHAIQIGSNFWT